MVTWTNKERTLLEDARADEEVCMKKYTNYASITNDPQLKQILTDHANAEQEHFDTLNQMLNGTVPDMNAQQQSQPNQQTTQSQPTQQQANIPVQPTQAPAMQIAEDKKICQDLLMTEKYVSTAYNTSIFEFKDQNARDVLNHIQKEEQEHGYDLYNYMEQHGMY
ncbi:spore coat protein [Clostridium sp. DL1XJH146]